MLENYSEVFSARFEEDVKGKYFVAGINPEQKLINYQIEMLENNNVSNIVKFDIRTKNGVSELWYDITGLSQIDAHIEKNKLRGEELIKYFSQFITDILGSNKLFLEDKRFLLDSSAVFVDKDMNPKLIYLPLEGYECDIKENFKKLFSKLSLEVEVAPGVGDMVQVLTKELNSEGFNFKSFATKLESLKKVSGNKAAVQNGTASKKPSVQPVPVQRVSQASIAAAQQMPQVQPAVQQPVQPIRKAAEPVTKKTNKSGKQEISDKGDSNTAKKEKKTKGGNTLLIILMQVIILLAIVGMIVTGLIDSFELTQKAGIVILVAALDYLVINKLNGGEKKKEQKPKKETKDKKSEKKKNNTKNKASQKSDISFSLSNKPVFEASKPESIANVPKKDVSMQAAQIEEEATMINADDESTVILQEESQAYIIENEGGIGTKTYINANPFVIGKSVQGTDLICQSKHVSRHHAQILSAAGQYYIMDMGSTNGTFLNGNRLEANMQYPLNSGDILTFAKSEYTFFI